MLRPASPPRRARRILCTVVRAALFAAFPGMGSARADEIVRIMAANTTSGNLQSYAPGDGIRIFQALDPDIALIQEFNYGTNSSADLRGFVDLAFGPEFAYQVEGGNEQIPNGIVSRYPIIQAGEWIGEPPKRRHASR